MKLILFLIVEILLFTWAAMIHAGVVPNGYEHARAATAESVIGIVLTLGLLGSLARPAATPLIAFGVQAFALLGTLVGAFTIAIGIGPQTRADVFFHALLLVVLVAGVFTAWRTWRRTGVPPA